MENMEKKKKKPNIVLYTIFMLIVFTFITEVLIWGYGSDIILEAILKYPQSKLVISEAVLAALVLIVMLLFKNSYVFTQKHEKISKGLFYGLFYIVVAVLFTLLFGVLQGGFSNVFTIINLALGCFFVGVAEEFLCRGWLLNEFLERFGDSKKGIWYSIIISGFIFGLIHLSNIYGAGQDVPTTIMQVISAAATGIFLGLIYYKTKNIWSVIILHGFWDFSLYLSNIAPVSSTTEMTRSFSIITMILMLVVAGIELLNLIPHIKDISKEPSKGSVIKFGLITPIFYILFTIIAGFSNADLGDTYEFDSLNLDSYAITRDNYNLYYMKGTNQAYRALEPDASDVVVTNEDYSIKLEKNDKNNLVLTNEKTKYSVELECDSLNDYIILEDDEYYVLSYVDYTDSINPFLYYSYISKDSITNDNEFLDNIKSNMKKYLLSERSELVILTDRDNNKSYVTAYNSDYGYYVLVEEGKMSILNRDK